MQSTFLLALVTGSTFLLGACQSASVKPDTDYKQITTTEQFEELDGKKLLFTDGQYAVINKDGTLGGFFGGKTLAGTWEVVDGYWCRTITAGPDYTLVNPTNCQKYERDGNKLKITRDKGQGQSFNLSLIHI